MFPAAYLQFPKTIPLFFELVNEGNVNEIEYCALITSVKVSMRVKTFHCITLIMKAEKA